MTVDKLIALLPYSTGSDAIKLNKTISNWNTVLQNYRSHNADLTPMFSAETQQFIQVISQYQSFKQTENDPTQFLMLAAQETLSFLQSTVYVYAFATLFSASFIEVFSTCDQSLPALARVPVLGSAIASAYPSIGYLQAVCDDFSSGAWQSFASMITGACAGMSADGEADNPLGSSSLFQHLCSSETLTGDLIPGGIQSAVGPETLLGFLSDSKKLITFGADSPIDLSWISSVSESTTVDVGYSAKTSNAIDTVSDSKFSIFGVQISESSKFGVSDSFQLDLGRSSDEEHQSLRTVTVSLGDNDKGDFFAVRITEDPVYGTPVFTTMGGASKCPGETGTSRRESNVRILEIRERCGANKASPCDEHTLNPGDNANFGVIIENLSPTQDEVYYTLRTSPFDDYLRSGGDGNYTCGVSGQQSGLVVVFSREDIYQIPYNRLVEVQFTVSNVLNGPLSLCDEFNDVQVQLIATCEIPTSNSQVYQYGVLYNTETKQTEILYNSADRIYASNSTATFSVKWPATRRRLQTDSKETVPVIDLNHYHLIQRIEDIEALLVINEKRSMILIFMVGFALVVGLALNLRPKFAHALPTV